MSKLLTLIFSALLSFPAFTYNEFDRFRCKGKLIFQGDPLEKVVKYCGEPISRRNWGNQYQTQNHLMFKAPGRSGCYKTFFVNKRIQDSKYIGYGCR